MRTQCKNQSQTVMQMLVIDFIKEIEKPKSD